MRNIVNKKNVSKDRFKVLFKGIPIPTYSWQKIDENLILVDYNDAADKLTNGMMKNYVGSKASEMYKDQPEILEELYRCANDQINIFREMKYNYMSTGKVKFLSVKYGFIPPDLVIVHTEDITEKQEVLERLKKSEQEFKELSLKLKQRISISEEKYKAIFENTGTAILICEEDTTISLVNGQFEELSGYSREEIEWKKSWTEFVIEEDLERMKKLDFSRRKDPESTQKKYEFRFVTKEGNIRDILIIIDMIPGTKRKVGSLLDITERKKAEEIIKKEVEKSKNYLNIAGVVIVALDTAGNITLLNKKGHELLGYDEGELIGKNWFEVCLPPRERERVHEYFKKLITGEIELINFYENPIWTKTREEKLISWSTVLFKDENGNTTGGLSSGEDITERKKAEEDLKESEEKYRDAYNRAEFYKDIFTHDINNILQSILSGTQIGQLLLNDHEKFDDLKLNAEIIKEQVIRGAKLIKNVRKLSKLEEAGQSLEKIEILSVLKNTVSFIERSYMDKNLTIQVDSIEEKLFTKANNFLEDVFENLLINAIRHNKNSMIEITIRISREQDLGMKYHKMEFFDNGIGVDDSMKNKIFQRGYNEGKGVPGLGLGLSLVRRIIETYSGKIMVEDRVMGDRLKGSNFVLLISEVD